MSYRAYGPEGRENPFWVWNGRGDMHRLRSIRAGRTVVDKLRGRGLTMIVIVHIFDKLTTLSATSQIAVGFPRSPKRYLRRDGYNPLLARLLQNKQNIFINPSNIIQVTRIISQVVTKLIQGSFEFAPRV